MNNQPLKKPVAPTSKLSNHMYAIRDMQAPTTMDSPMLFLMQPLHPLKTVDAADGRGGQALHPNGVVRDVQLISPRLQRKTGTATEFEVL